MSSNPLKAPCIVLSVLALTSVAAAGIMTFSNSELNERLDSSRAELEEARLSISSLEGEAAALSDSLANAESELASALEAAAEPPETEPPAESAYTPPVTDENTIYIYDNGIDIVEYPQIEGVSLNDYNMSLLETDDRKHKALYDENGNKRSRFGIDVSAYQNNIDWQRVAADDVEFAIIRAGFRGYETGALALDRYFMRNITGAHEAGIPVGVYFFSQALSAEEAEEEADYVLGLIEEAGVPLDFPVIFDWEFHTDEDPARTEGMPGETQTECARAFCDKIKAAGYETMYYATINTSIFRYDMGALSDIPLWVADYHADTNYVYDYKMWQYSCSGVVDGIENFVDFNIWIDN